MQQCDQLGLAARFVSGYLIQLVPDTTAVDGPTGASADFTDGIHYHIGDVWGSIVADEAPTSATTISWTY